MGSDSRRFLQVFRYVLWDLLVKIFPMVFSVRIDYHGDLWYLNFKFLVCRCAHSCPVCCPEDSSRCFLIRLEVDIILDPVETCLCCWDVVYWLERFISIHIIQIRFRLNYLGSAMVKQGSLAVTRTIRRCWLISPWLWARSGFVFHRIIMMSGYVCAPFAFSCWVSLFISRGGIGCCKGRGWVLPL